MKKIVYILFFLSAFIGESQMIIGTASNQQARINIGFDPDVIPTKTRFLIAGASIAWNTFLNTGSMKTMVESAYPGTEVFFYNHASPGETIETYAYGNVPNITNTLSLYNNSNPDIKTYVIIDLGGNDRTNSGVWSGLTELKKSQLSTALDDILNAIEAKGFTPILNDQTFRIYDSNADEDYGILPYNENLIQPKILSRTSEFAFEDGQSFWQMYTVIYNNYETYLSGDDIHPSGAGYSALRTAFVNTICKYIFTGVPPTKIEKE